MTCWDVKLAFLKQARPRSRKRLQSRPFCRMTLLFGLAGWTGERKKCCVMWPKLLPLSKAGKTHVTLARRNCLVDNPTSIAKSAIGSTIGSTTTKKATRGSHIVFSLPFFSNEAAVCFQGFSADGTCGSNQKWCMERRKSSRPPAYLPP
jgi:hypothetical protein